MIVKSAKNILLAILLFGNYEVFSQPTGYYYKYTFEDFVRSKPANEEAYVKTIYRTAKYPRADREQGIEGVIRVIIISHGPDNIEIIVPTQIGTLHEAAIHAIEEANSKFPLNSNEKFMTELFIKYDMEPWEKHSQSTDTIVVLAGLPKYRETKLVNNN